MHGHMNVKKKTTQRYIPGDSILTGRLRENPKSHMHSFDSYSEHGSAHSGLLQGEQFLDWTNSH